MAIAGVNDGICDAAGALALAVTTKKVLVVRIKTEKNAGNFDKRNLTAFGPPGVFYSSYPPRATKRSR